MWLLCALTVLLGLIPALQAFLGTPAAGDYLGYQYNLDDHMVYAAWMRQAMGGHFLFDNRFATDPQPGLTVHIYFLILGWVAKVLGIGLTTALARSVLAVAFLHLTYRLVRKISPSIFATKLILTLTAFGGGIGYLVWHNFGLAIVKPEASPFSSLMLGKLPTDVWQPEGYVFSSLLTNSLFMLSLCLIMGIFLCVLAARENPAAVLPGAIGMALLMNIHSYDVVLVTLALLALLVMEVAQKRATTAWILRVLCIGLGTLVPALWFVYVLKNDPVFQARAATETYSPNFRQLIFGYLPLLVGGMVALYKKQESRPRLAAVLGLGAVLVALFVMASMAGEKYWLSLGPWLILAAVCLVALWFLSSDSPGWNLIAGWAVIGLIAPYFPALFQRKLAMGLAVPWAILAGLGVAALLARQERGARNLATALGLLVACGSSLRWLVREVQLSALNVSNTTVHSVYLSSDVKHIVELLNQQSAKRVVVLAMPGIASPAVDEAGAPVPDSFRSPYIPDLNPVLSGLTAVYTYAGHWSETPDYLKRRNLATTLFCSVRASAPLHKRSEGGFWSSLGRITLWLLCPRHSRVCHLQTLGGLVASPLMAPSSSLLRLQRARVERLRRPAAHCCPLAKAAQASLS